MARFRERAKPLAVVLIPDRESRPTALGLIRSLGRVGVPVVAAASCRTTPSFLSRYVQRRLVTPPLDKDQRRWKEALIQFARSLVDKPVLYPSADEHVWAVHQNRNELSKYFHYPFLNRRALLSCIDKREMYKVCKCAGIETGKTVLVPNAVRPEEIAAQAVFPSVVKPAMWVNLNDERPRRYREFFQEFKQKAVSVNDKQELYEVLGRATHLSVPVLLQEEVPGPASAIYHVSLYADKTSGIRGLFVARKGRQYPSKFGNACMIEPVVCPEIAALARSFVKAIGFHGIAGALEFKRHPHTGRLHFIEINPRASASISAATASGVNLPHLAYLDAVGAELPNVTQTERPVRWIEGRSDVLYWLSYRKGDHTGQPLSLLNYLRSLRGRREYAYWAVDDPIPWAARAAGLPRDIWLALKDRAAPRARQHDRASWKSAVRQ